MKTVELDFTSENYEKVKQGAAISGVSVTKYLQNLIANKVGHTQNGDSKNACIFGEMELSILLDTIRTNDFKQPRKYWHSKGVS